MSTAISEAAKKMNGCRNIMANAFNAAGSALCMSGDKLDASFKRAAEEFWKADKDFDNAYWQLQQAIDSDRAARQPQEWTQEFVCQLLETKGIKAVAHAHNSTLVQPDSRLKEELAYVKLQRDKLLEITWLDLPEEPSESTARWKEQFSKGWVRRSEQPDAKDTERLALSDVLEERNRQDAKWGEQNHAPIDYLAILIEEVGEFAQAALHLKFGGPEALGVRSEAVQIAAVALAIVQCLDRAKWEPREHALACRSRNIDSTMTSELAAEQK